MSGALENSIGLSRRQELDAGRSEALVGLVELIAHVEIVVNFGAVPGDVRSLSFAIRHLIGSLKHFYKNLHPTGCEVLITK